MQLPVYKRDGSKSAETVDIPDELLRAEPSDHAIWLAVRSEEAASRQGTAMTKNRKLVRGGGRKPFRQKGRGVARQGTTRSPLNPGGGTIHGPQPRAYVVKLTDKMKKAARRSAFIYKVRADQVRVVEDFSFPQPRTRDIAAVFESLGLAAERVLLLMPNFDTVMAKSVRNLPRAVSLKAATASTRDLMNCSVVLLQRSAVPELVKVLDHAA